MSLQRAINVAFSVFENSIQVTKDQIDEVAEAVHHINMQELDVRPEHLRHHSHVFSKIIDHPYLNFDIFYVTKGCSLPLHDHPGMTGVMKVLFGEMKVRSYTVTSTPGLKRTGGKKTLRCTKTADLIYTPNDRPAVLSAEHNNIHEIIAITDMAFFDCLAPPYKDNCSFYRFASGYDEANESVELLSIGTEADYHTNPRRYTGASVHMPGS